MKKIFYLLCSLCMTTSLVSCSQKEETSTATVAPTSSAESITTTTSEPTEESTSEVIDLYEGDTNLVELSFGIIDELFTFSVPSDYVVTGLKMNVNDEEQAYDGLLSQDTTLQEAIDNGVFNEGRPLSSIDARKLGDDDIQLFSVVYLTRDISWDELISSYENVQEIENSPFAAVTFDSEYLKKPCAAVSFQMGDYIFSFVYTGSLNDTVDHTELANSLFNLIIFK